jgi:hypothetical protein
MSTRKIKDAKDLSTNELIYFKGHAQATYMSDGRTVEEAITSSTGGSGGTGGTIDTSNFATKTELAQKQDTLVSGTNIKTINGTTILGSGDITISGGSSTTPMRYSTPAASIIIPMNMAKVITSVNTTNQTFILGTNLTVITNPVNITQEQKWEIVFAINASLSTAPTITFNTGGIGTIYWINGVAPTFEVGKFYEVSFLNAGGILLGVCAEFSAAS